MRTSYLFKQVTGLITLIIFTFVAHYYVRHIYLEINNTVLQQLLMIIAISFLFFVFNQLIYNYAKKNQDKFMKHKVWDKMFFIIFICLSVSIVIFITLFFITPLQALISSQQWIMLIIMYYFLFLLNLFILSIVHKVVNKSTTVEKKLLLTWGSSTIVIFLVLFLLPSL